MAKKRFEVGAAYAMGILLPVGEIFRRRTDFSTVAGYVDDFIIGGLLLFAARSASRGKPNSSIVLVAVWAILCGGLYSSFFGQLGRSAAHDVSGLANTTMVAIKGVLYGIALLSLWLSFRAASREHGAD